MQKIYFSVGILLAILLISACSSPKPTYKNFKVGHKGALKNMMHLGDISAKANLVDYKDIKHLYAIGALENLKGEIQIFDGKLFNTSVIDGKVAFDDTFDKKAPLFVYAAVEKWMDIKIPSAIITYEQFEIFVEQKAKESGINTDEPFPFLLNGTAKSFDWHIINWKDGDTEHSHEKHVNSGLHGTIQDRGVEMLGFYSNAHHAIFTHHTTNMHIHVKTTDNALAGHVDVLTLGEGMVLKLPVVKN